jgi:exosome complex component RRP4
MTEIKNYEIVTPGTLLSENGEGGEGTYTEGKKVFSKFLGTVQVYDNRISVSPMTSSYIPHEGDNVIGRIIEVSTKYWGVDIDAPYYTRLDSRDVNFRTEIGELDKYLALGDLIYARVFRIYANNSADVSMRGSNFGKLESNRVSKINISRIPRLIGKEGSMINMIKEMTGCEVLVGQNGVVWVNGPEDGKAAALAAVKFIDENYMNQNMVESVRRLLENVRGKV